MDILKGLHKEFAWLIWGLVGIGLIWFLTGGASDPDARQPYIKPLAPIDSGDTYGRTYFGGDPERQETLNLPEAPARVARTISASIISFFSQPRTAKEIHPVTRGSGELRIDGIAGAAATSPQDEYLRIIAESSAKAPLSLEGMTITGDARDIIKSIPTAADLLVLGTPYLKTAVSVPAEGRVLITSGRSPVGTSFRVNICSGYLDQFQSYTPDLRKDCPEPLDELKASGPYEEESCRKFVETIPRCRTYEETLPSDISPTCKAFVAETLNYNSCVYAHQKERGFLKNEWRLFLEETKELWRSRQEIIRLRDAKGEVLDAITF